MPQVLSNREISCNSESPNCIIRAVDVSVSFIKRSRVLRRSSNSRNNVVNNVSLDIFGSEIVSLVGETGSGKTTLAKCIASVIKPDSGRIFFRNKEISNLKGKAKLEYFRSVQMIYQDPYGSLVPRWNIFTSLSIPLAGLLNIKEKPRQLEIVSDLLSEVDLNPEEVMNKYPHQLSGGERQRVNIARALCSNPDVLIADEPVTMLDASQRMNILLLLKRLNKERGLSVLFITHDLASAKIMGGRMLVMYLGKIIESGPALKILSRPHHPYASLILSATPTLRPREGSRSEVDEGDIEQSTVVTQGCVFRPRCRYRTSICYTVEPILEEKSSSHFAACHNSL
jgi:peptide/nickel transport system ATP-binding protein